MPFHRHTPRLSVAALFPTILLLLATACGGGTAPGTSAGDGPSLLVITVDTTRHDAFSCTGRDAAQTPNIDALAARGALFSQARAPAPITLVSHTSLFTGLRPYHHGVRDNGTFRLPASATTLAEELGDRGYSTAAFVGAAVLGREFGHAVCTIFIQQKTGDNQ